jgi:hypothetical protein
VIEKSCRNGEEELEPFEDNLYPYKKYKDNIINIYKDERLECYYLPKIKELLQSICSDKEKVINVSENKKNNGIHAKVRSVYADKGGLQDLIIVPVSYSYENPTKPYITVEVKSPNIDIEDNAITKYNELKVEIHEGQLNEQFKKTSFIVFTDCITWYLLNKNSNNEIDVERIPLVDGFDCDSEHENKVMPGFWKEQIEKLTKFLEKSKENYEK